MNIYKKKIARNMTDSFFYKGLIAETKDFELFATGDIKRTCDHEIENDKDANRCYDEGCFALNNWFEVVPKDEENCSFCCSDSVCGCYKQAIETLKDYQELHEEENKKLKK